MTATDAFFIRNHGSVPAVDVDEYRLTVVGEVRAPLVLSLRDLRGRFPRASVTATLACAGNRRRELRPPPSGIPWGAGAVGNAVWTGARLRDVLLAGGIAPGARHVAFEGLDDVSGRRFGGSIPLEKAMCTEVLLAHEINGASLPPEHGFPVRAIVPGYIGARSVKWLARISVQREPSASFFQRHDYALNGTPLSEVPLTSALGQPREGAIVRGSTVEVAGYAIGAGGRSVEAVEVSSDGGRTWTNVAGPGSPWAWRLWHANVDLPLRSTELVVRARDDSGEWQPEQSSSIWNPRGYMNNGWHRIQVVRRVHRVLATASFAPSTVTDTVPS